MKAVSIRKYVLMKILFIPFLIFFAGCYYAVVGVVGSVAALGGYIVSPDAVEGITEHDFDTIWSKADEIVSIMGKIKEQKRDEGVMLADVGGCRVIVTIITLTESTVKMNVKARKAFFPKINVAQDVFVKIMGHLNK